MPEGVQTGQWRWVGTRLLQLEYSSIRVLNDFFLTIAAITGGEISAASHSHYGVRGAASVAAWPGARAHHTLVVGGAGESVWLFGGQGFATAGSELGFLNDLWEFCDGLWRWVGGASWPGAVGNYGKCAVHPLVAHTCTGLFVY